MPKKSKKLKKIIQWTLGVILFLFIALTGFAWYLNIKYKPIISDEIKALLYKSTDGLYNISFDNVTTNLLTGNAALLNVKIVADTARFKELIALKRAPNNLYTVHVHKLLIKHFDPVSFIKDGKLNIELLLFEQPEVLMANKQFDFNENRPPMPIKSPYDFISKALNAFSIQTIEFKDASFKYINNNIAKPKVFLIANLDIVLKDLLIDATSANDSTRLFLLKDVELNLNDYDYHTPDGLYTVKLSQLAFSASSGALSVKKFSLIPRFKEMDFAKAVGHNADRFSIQMNNIALSGINLPLYIRKQELRAKEMTVSNGAIDVFNDNTLLKSSNEKKLNSFPHQLLQNVHLPVQIQKILLKNINIGYAIYSAKSMQRGHMSFDHTTGTISNFTNLPSVKAKDSIMEANLVSYLMGQGKLNVNFKFNLNDVNGAFAYSGVLNALNARSINRITKPLGLVQINRGNIDKLKFDFNANNEGAIGKVDFWYFDLSVALMRNDEETGRLVKRGLMSFLANALIINSENPNKNGDFTSAGVVYERPKNTSFFNLIWRSLFQGIKYSVGITEEKQNKIKQSIAKFKAIKASRLERKMHREERRGQENKERKEKR